MAPVKPQTMTTDKPTAKYRQKRSAKTWLSRQSSSSASSLASRESPGGVVDVDGGGKLLTVSCLVGAGDEPLSRPRPVKNLQNYSAPQVSLKSSAIIPSATTTHSATALSEELQRDVKIIQMRNYLDTKRFYKSADQIHANAQSGTVIESAAEYYSGRLTKKERGNNLVEEIMGDRDRRKSVHKDFKKIMKSKGQKGTGRGKGKKGIVSSKNLNKGRGR